jgi:hypothetical protein
MEAQAVEEVLCGCRVEQGWLNLNRVNDLLYTVDFRPYKNEKFSHLPCYKVDLDSIELDDSCGVISIKDSEPYLNFQALDVTEFNLFQGMCGALPLQYLFSLLTDFTIVTTHRGETGVRSNHKLEIDFGYANERRLFCRYL